MDKRNVGRVAVVRPLAATLGRRNLYRLSRFLIRESRRDTPNAMSHNGEQMVQAVVLEKCAYPVVFDVGANVGEWTASLMKLAGNRERDVTVHAFEPCAGTYQLLCARIQHERWGNVTAVPGACSSAPGTATMMVQEDGYGTNSIVDPVEPVPMAHPESVDLTSVDAYSATHGINHIDLLKVDTEGHDFEVIQGSRGMLERDTVHVLQFEYNQRWIGARRYLRDVFLLLQPMGYSIGKVTPEGVEFYPTWHWEMETFVEGNYLACTSEWKRHFRALDPTWLAGN